MGEFFPRELCLLHVATQSNQTLAPFWSPFIALANTFSSHPRLLWGSYSFAPIWLPHNPWKKATPKIQWWVQGLEQAALD